MNYLAPIAIGFSAILIATLCLGDPKRRRASGQNARTHSVGTRRLLVTMACMPGLYFAFAGDAALFLNWLGGCGVIGWIVALIMSKRQVRETQ